MCNLAGIVPEHEEHGPIDAGYGLVDTGYVPLDMGQGPAVDAGRVPAVDAGQGPMAAEHGPAIDKGNKPEHEPEHTPEHEPDGSPEKGAGSKVVDVFRYLTGNEGLELVRLESTRQSLLRAQGFLEEKSRFW